MRTPRISHVARAAVVATALALALGACGGDDDDDTAAPDDITAAPTTSAPTTTTGGPDGTDTTPPAADGDAWSLTAGEHRGSDGETFSVECTPDGAERNIWGVETYTDDSSVCTAAVHVGLITFADGGEVTYEIAPGLDEYESGHGNGVSSRRYGAFEGSFTFPDAPPGSGDFAVGAETWSRTATEYRGRDGEEIAVECAPGGPAGSIWGTGTYTDDSSICTAAVHQGLITLEAGGRVTIEIAPGEDGYEGSAANGVTSSEYASYEGSFTFPDDQ